MMLDCISDLRGRAGFRTGAAAILAVAGGHAPSDFGLRVSEATANFLLFGLGPGPSAVLGRIAASLAEIPHPERWKFADPKIFATGATGPDAALVESGHGGLGQVEAKGVGTPEHFAHSGGCPAGLHLDPVGQATAYGDACWVREPDRLAFQRGPRIWVAHAEEAPDGWTLVSPLAIIDQAKRELDQAVAELIDRVWKLIYAGEWGDYPAIGGVTEREVAEAAAAATAAQPKRPPSWYDADHLANLAGVSEVLDRRADKGLFDRFGLCLKTGEVVGVRRSGGRIQAYVEGGAKPDPARFPIVARIGNRDNPESPLDVHDVGRSDDSSALADFVERLAA